jgi:hypothetical protein
MTFLSTWSGIIFRFTTYSSPKSALAEPWKTKVREAKAISIHLRRFFAQTKPLAFGIKKTNIIIIKSEIKCGLLYAYFLYDLTFSKYRIFSYYVASFPCVEFSMPQ